MRINKFVAQATGLSRRAADQAISEDRVLINSNKPSTGQQVEPTDIVTLDGKIVNSPSEQLTIMLNKPVGYVCSRNGQGSATVYELLPAEYQTLKSVGRLDKNSSGLLLLTNDGDLANQLTHPKFAKVKIYEIRLDKPLEPLHQQMINDVGIVLEDGPSRLILQKMDSQARSWQVTMSEGRNRQIRRTFEKLGYKVKKLERTNFGPYSLGDLTPGNFKIVTL